MDGRFVVFGFGAPGEDVVYLEHTTNDLLREEADAVTQYDFLVPVSLKPSNPRSRASSSAR
jgi:hypothetical protein